METQPDNLQDQELLKLEQQLRETVNAEKFFETNTGILWTQMVTEEITRALNDISSDKYEKDHSGYVKRLADLQAYKRILKKMQLAGSPIRKQKILERLEDSKK